MQRELAAGDRIMERAFCAGPVDRLTIRMPDLGRVRAGSCHVVLRCLDLHLNHPSRTLHERVVPERLAGIGAQKAVE